MADAGAMARGAVRTFRLLNAEQRIAAIGALLLIVSTFGPFSFVEAAEILIAVGVLALLRARAEGQRFHLPFGDGTAIAAAGIWAGVLIVARLFDRPLGQNLLALACAAILVVAGARERAKRPADDLPPEHATTRPDPESAPDERPAREPARPVPPEAERPPAPEAERPADSPGWEDVVDPAAPTQRLGRDDAPAGEEGGAEPPGRRPQR
jgi:hypothetical protein